MDRNTYISHAVLPKISRRKQKRSRYEKVRESTPIIIVLPNFKVSHSALDGRNQRTLLQQVLVVPRRLVFIRHTGDRWTVFIIIYLFICVPAVYGWVPHAECVPFSQGHVTQGATKAMHMEDQISSPHHQLWGRYARLTSSAPLRAEQPETRKCH